MKRTNVRIEVEYRDQRCPVREKSTKESIDDEIPMQEGTKQVLLQCVCFEKEMSWQEAYEAIESLNCHPAAYYERVAVLNAGFGLPIPSPLLFIGSDIEVWNYECFGGGHEEYDFEGSYTPYVFRHRGGGYPGMRSYTAPAGLYESNFDGQFTEKCEKAFPANVWFALVAK